MGAVLLKRENLRENGIENQMGGLRASPPVVLKPGFGGKSSATSVGCDPTLGAIYIFCGGKFATFSTRVFLKRC